MSPSDFNYHPSPKVDDFSHFSLKKPRGLGLKDDYQSFLNEK